MSVMKNLNALGFGAVAVLAIFAAGCSSGGQGDTSGPPAESAASPTAAVTVADSPGHSLFIAKGCAACHGQNAEGTTIAPALPGHNEQMVKNQVRNPRFQMPAFSLEQISDEELEAIAGFIVNLEEGDGHQHQEVMAQTAAVEMHHWMALESLEAQDSAEAIHHVDHIIGLLGPGEHEDRMLGILALLKSGEDSHEPEHEIEEMLAGSASPGLTIFQLHLRQALDALDGDNVSEAQHHVAHAQETGDDSTAAGLAEVQEFLGLEDRHGAEHDIQEILGLEEDHD